MQPSAKRAIDVLQLLQDELGAEALAFWVLPNTILTLSGARPYADGVFWDDDQKGLLDTWNSEIKRSLEALSHHVSVIWSDSSIHGGPTGQSYAGYDLIAEDGLRYMFEQSELLQSVSFDLLKQAGSASEIHQSLYRDLRAQHRYEDISDENIRHIAMGLLLGYPDKAIVESVRIWDRDDSASAWMPARIHYADYYVCPEPVYDYPRSLESDAMITAHERLWSGILRDFYESDFHKLLTGDKKFLAKMSELHNLREA